MHQFSDSDTPDSDDGRRFKTENTRPKKAHTERVYSRYKSPSPRRRSYEERRRKSRSRSPRYNRSRRHNDVRSGRKEESRSYSKYKEKEDRRTRGEKDDRKTREEKEDRRTRDEKEDRRIREENSSREKHSSKINKKDVESSKKHNENLIGESPPPLQKEENKHKEDRNPGSYGPTLPPTLLEKNKEEISQVDNETYGPTLPPPSLKHQKVTGPNLLSNELDKQKEENLTSSSEKNEKVIGPDLPHHLREQLATKACEANCSELSDSDDDNIIGPCLPQEMQSEAHIALEERALQIKINNLSDGGEKVKKREEWMVELPAVRSAGLGLSPRQFRANAGPDMGDRSSWTETPEDKLRKETGGTCQEIDLKKEAELREIRKRDTEQEKIIKKHKKQSRREEKSLLEMHQSKVKKEKESEKTVERRPFSRDIDLKVNRFDEAQKKAILKKAQLLDNRFSSGQAKYL